jgi:sugar lactone lactonase YvrE
VDLSKNEIARVYLFPDSIAPQQSYLNDVRIDTKRRFAYITDSGLGALVILDLDSGESWRVLASDSSTKAQDIVLNIDGTPWLGPDSSKPQVHVDGIALDQDGTHVYYHALTARNLYRIETQWLRTVGFSDEDLAKKVEFVAETGGCDGMIFGKDGNLYLSAIELNAVQRFTANKKLQVIVKDSLLDWPDSFSNAPDGILYVTASQINIPPGKRGLYRLFKFKP